MITVIIPMYNTENCIERCLNSVVSQNFSDLEIIVVDDGSTDGSADKVRALAQKDQRIRLIEQENHGLVYSRKVGINKATGEYVLFVDSDDYLESDVVEKMAVLAKDNQADVVACGAIFEVDGSRTNGKTVKNYAEAKLYADGEVKELKEKLFCAADFCTMALLPFLWNKLWKTELIKEFVLRADDRFAVGEDVAIGFPAIMAAKRVFVSDYAGYHYCQRQTSMMRNTTGDDREYANACRIYRYLLALSDELNWSANTKEGLQRFLINQMLTRCYEKINRDMKIEKLAGFTESMPDKLVIYGAGELGKAVYSYAAERTEVVAWIDKDAEYLRALGYNVALPDETDIPGDCPVIVAVFDERAVGYIRQYLISRGVAPERIITFDPNTIRLNYYIFGAHPRGQTMRAYMKALFPERNFLGYLYDNDEKNPDDIDGETVERLDSALENGLDTEARVYIATRGVYHDEIKEKLIKLDFKDIVPVDAALDIEFRNRFVPEYFRSRGWEFRRIASDASGNGSHWREKNRQEPSPMASEKDRREPSPMVFVIRSAVDKPLSDDVPLRSYESFIQAGSTLTEQSLDNCDYFDDKGDTISERNRQMCELTAMYWIWKNYTGQIVGAEHYRRRFILPDNWQSIMEAENIDVILPVPLYVHPTLKDNYCQRHESKTWEVMEQALFEVHPECAEDAIHFFESTSCYSPCNMLIAGKEAYDEMCEWLFPILFSVIEKCGTLDDAYQNRYPGFLAERLITYFFRMKSDEYNIVYSDKNFLK